MSEQVVDQKNAKLNSLKDQLNKQNHANDNESEELFIAHKKEFTSNGLSELRSIGGKTSDDSNFVLTGMRFLYREEIHRLVNISVTGGSRKKNKVSDEANNEANKDCKEKMSPIKLQAIKNAYTERLNALGLGEKEFGERAKRLNVHLNNAIQHLNPKNNKTQRLNDLNEQINLNANKMSNFIDICYI